MAMIAALFLPSDSHRLHFTHPDYWNHLKAGIARMAKLDGNTKHQAEWESDATDFFDKWLHPRKGSASFESLLKVR